MSSSWSNNFCLLTLFYSTGTNVEGILRQSADVEEVDHRVQEYEQGSFSALVIARSRKKIIDIILVLMNV